MTSYLKSPPLRYTLFHLIIGRNVWYEEKGCLMLLCGMQIDKRWRIRCAQHYLNTKKIKLSTMPVSLRVEKSFYEDGKRSTSKLFSCTWFILLPCDDFMLSGLFFKERSLRAFGKGASDMLERLKYIVCQQGDGLRKRVMYWKGEVVRATSLPDLSLSVRYQLTAVQVYRRGHNFARVSSSSKYTSWSPLSAVPQRHVNLLIVLYSLG